MFSLSFRVFYILSWSFSFSSYLLYILHRHGRRTHHVGLVVLFLLLFAWLPNLAHSLTRTVWKFQMSLFCSRFWTSVCLCMWAWFYYFLMSHFLQVCLYSTQWTLSSWRSLEANSESFIMKSFWSKKNENSFIMIL